MLTKKRAQQILKNATGQSVLSCGDVMLDAYLTGKVERFSQEAPVPIIPVSEEKFFPGGAGNAAACMATANIIPHLVSVVGNRERISYSDILKTECVKMGIFPHFEIDHERKTTLKLRLTAIRTTNQHVARVDMEDIFPLNKKIELKIIHQIEALFRKIAPPIISIHDYKKGFLTEAIFKCITNLSHEYSVPIFADLKQDTFIQFKSLIKNPKLFYLKPNKNESVQTAKLLNGFDKDGNTDSEIIEIARIIQAEIPINIIITRGEKGAVLFQEKEKPYFVRPEEVEEQFDVAGAGDTVEAFLVVAYLGGATMHEALELAVTASQIAIRKFGTSVVTNKELLSWIDNHN